MSDLKDVDYDTPKGEPLKTEELPLSPPVAGVTVNTVVPAEVDAAEDKFDEAQASGFAKLEKLGLTPDEITALFGVEPPDVKAARKKERRAKHEQPKAALKKTTKKGA